jgi:uncharacterized protein (TIGR03437 family)
MLNILAGSPFSSWNPYNAGADPTLGTLSALAWKFIEHAELQGRGYRTPTKRLMAFLQMFNASVLASYDPQHNTQAGATFRATLMVTALSYAFAEDLRSEFRALNFPIDDAIYSQLYTRALTNGPAIDRVEGAGLSVPMVTTLTPNGLFSIFGSGFAPSGTAATAQVLEGALSTSLAQTCVQTGTQMAPLTYVSPTQINALLPVASNSGMISVTVVANCGTQQQSTSAPVSVPVAAQAPEFLYFVNNANGQNPVAAIDAVSTNPIVYIGPPGLISGVTFTPAKVGEILSIFGVGFGATTPAQNPGVLATGPATVSAGVTVMIGGQQAKVDYAGVSPNYAGLYQINLEVPNVAVGNQPISIMIGQAVSPAGAYLTIGQ